MLSIIDISWFSCWFIIKDDNNSILETRQILEKFHSHVNELCLGDHHGFYTYFHMSPWIFDRLLSLMVGSTCTMQCIPSSITQLICHQTRKSGSKSVQMLHSCGTSLTVGSINSYRTIVTNSCTLRRSSKKTPPL